MRQKTLNENYQKAAREQLAIMYPDNVPADGNDLEVPLVIALPAGIHPYNKASAYYDPAGNAIVLYQKLGRAAIRSNTVPPFVLATIRHELAHWYQDNVLKATMSPKTNVHRHSSWSKSCYVASRNLWPGLDVQSEWFRPYTSVRHPLEHYPVRVQREGAMTDVELHHWPRSMDGFLAQRTANTKAA